MTQVRSSSRHRHAVSANLRKACQVLYFRAVAPWDIGGKGTKYVIVWVMSPHLAPACFSAHVVHCPCWCSAAPQIDHPSVPGASCISMYVPPVVCDQATQFMCGYSTGNISNLLRHGLIYSIIIYSTDPNAHIIYYTDPNAHKY